MAKSCILLKGNSQYDVLSYFLQAFKEAFEQEGYICYVIDLSEKSEPEAFLNNIRYLIKRKNIEFIFSINTQMVFAVIEGKRSVITQLIGSEAPYISYMVDSLYYHYEAVAETEGIDAFSFIDEESVEYVNKILNKKAVFIPHGACLSQLAHKKETVKKTIDILFAGSFGNENTIYQRASETLDVHLFKIFNDLIDYMDSHFNVSVKDAIDHVSKENSFSVPESKKLLLYCQIASIAGADAIVRIRRRNKVLLALSKTDFKTTVYGSGGHNSSLYNHKNFCFHDSVSFTEILDKIARSKIVLNTMGAALNGAHERVFSAMLNGSVALTDSNAFWTKSFCHKEDILLYDYNALDLMGESISSVLEDRGLYNDITARARKKVLENYTWAANAQKVIALAAELKTGC